MSDAQMALLTAGIAVACILAQVAVLLWNRRENRRQLERLRSRR